jgi:hypothetical protein
MVTEHFKNALKRSKESKAKRAVARASGGKRPVRSRPPEAPEPALTCPERAW